MAEQLTKASWNYTKFTTIWMKAVTKDRTHEEQGHVQKSKNQEHTKQRNTRNSKTGRQREVRTENMSRCLEKHKKSEEVGKRETQANRGPKKVQTHVKKVSALVQIHLRRTIL